MERFNSGCHKLPGMHKGCGSSEVLRGQQGCAPLLQVLAQMESTAAPNWLAPTGSPPTDAQPVHEDSGERLPWLTFQAFTKAAMASGVRCNPSKALP